MMWSPPQVGRHPVAQYTLTLLIVAGLNALTGCASFAGLGEGAAIANNRSSAEPEFDDEPRVAVSRPVSGLISAPRPFSWAIDGQSSGRRRFQTAKIGDGDFHVLVIGSVGGDDPQALALVDQLTRHLHQDSQIIGGFRADVIRTLNPDGAATGSKLNALGEYINHGFPKKFRTDGGAELPQVVIPEARFLLEAVRQSGPRRIIHIRTVAGDTGLIGYDRQSKTAAIEAAGWLDFSSLDLGQRAVPGSLERYFAEAPQVEVLVFGIPESSAADSVWEKYGDALLNLMLEQDLATRDVARRRRNSESADRRNREFP